MNVLHWGHGAQKRLTLPATVVLAVVMLVAGAALLGQGDAHAANASVTVGSPTNRFSSNVSNLNAGDTVTFTWAAGTHIVDLKDVSPDINSDATHTSGTTTAFKTAGTYYYYCSVHASEALATEAHVQANDAMVGKIVVAGAGSPAAPSTGSGVAGGGLNELAAISLLAGACLVLFGATTFVATRK